LAEKGRGLSEARRAEFRSPRQHRVAQGTGEAGADPGSPFLCLLSFGEAKESETRLKRGKHSFRKGKKAKPQPPHCLQAIKFAMMPSNQGGA
jgi:hypothetical protein